MARKNRNFIDDMVDMFGYDYVIGHCLCSEYDLNNKADREEDADRKNKFRNMAKKYGVRAEQLTRERVENGL